MFEYVNNISVDSFVGGVNNIVRLTSNKEEREKRVSAYIKEHIVDRYISFADKKAVANKIVRSTCYISSGEGESKTEEFKADSSARYMMFRLMLIALYTDIEIKFGESVVDEYDKLDSINIIDLIIAEMPTTEVQKFRMVVDMELDDLYDNEREIANIILNAKNNFMRVFGGFIKGLTDQLKDIDEDSFNNIISAIVK